MQKLVPRTLAKSLAMLASLLWLISAVWHSLLGQPSLMPYMYSWFSFANPAHMAMLLALWVVAFYCIGYLIAAFYNRNTKKKRKRARRRER